MAELRQILDLWAQASAEGEEVCVATVVGVEGSSYRRPGARMLLTAGGRRSGTISGGCLEAEVTKKAWWLTEHGAAVQRYSSFFDDDGEMPYGLGCGGAIQVLLERGHYPSERPDLPVMGAGQALEALRRSVDERATAVIVARTAGKHLGTELIAGAGGETVYLRDPDPGENEEAWKLAQASLAAKASQWSEDRFAEYVAPPPAVYLFGAGDDAQPLAQMAWDLGWHVTVADGRSQLARRERFPQAAEAGPLEPALGSVRAEDAVVILTHSYEQDKEILRRLLGRDLRYLGILGPRQRTEHLVKALAPELGMSAAACLERLHSPVGLFLGAHSPSAIALSIAAELQAVFAGVPTPKATKAVPA